MEKGYPGQKNKCDYLPTNPAKKKRMSQPDLHHGVEYSERSASRVAWSIVGIMALILLIGLIIWFVWWLACGRHRNQSSCEKPTPCDKDKDPDPCDDKKKKHDSCQPVCVDQLHVSDCASIGGSLVVRNICASGHSISVSDPLVAAGGLQLVVHTVAHQHFRIHTCGIINCTNAGGALANLPKASHKSGCVIVIHNKTGLPEVTVQAHGADRIQLPGNQTFLVQTSSLFISDGIDTWMVLQ